VDVGVAGGKGPPEEVDLLFARGSRLNMHTEEVEDAGREVEQDLQ
jgi:hypothetical protein